MFGKKKKKPGYIPINPYIGGYSSTATAITFSGSSSLFSNESDHLKDLELSYSEEPIIGWRAWDILEFLTRHNLPEPRLASIASKHAWFPMEVNTAQCNHAFHEAPWQTCNCGFWAFKNEGIYKQAISGYGDNQKYIWGEVYLWGRVLEGGNGWRAQHAYPKSFKIPHFQNPAKMKMLIDLYDVPAEFVPLPEKPLCKAHVQQWDCQQDNFTLITTYSVECVFDCGGRNRFEKLTQEQVFEFASDPNAAISKLGYGSHYCMDG